mgnify:CR=1 FL=1
MTVNMDPTDAYHGPEIRGYNSNTVVRRYGGTTDEKYRNTNTNTTYYGLEFGMSNVEGLMKSLVSSRDGVTTTWYVDKGLTLVSSVYPSVPTKIPVLRSPVLILSSLYGLYLSSFVSPFSCVQVIPGSISGLSSFNEPQEPTPADPTPDRIKTYDVAQFIDDTTSTADGSRHLDTLAGYVDNETSYNNTAMSAASHISKPY